MRLRLTTPAWMLPSLALAAACSGSTTSSFGQPDGGTTPDSTVPVIVGGSEGGVMKLGSTDTGTISGGDGGLIVGDPTTCEQAAATKSYVGCEYWPTVTANSVDPTFDFAAVIANTQSTAATVTVTGPAGAGSIYPENPITVPANGLVTVYLPWVDQLKGTQLGPLEKSVHVLGGAYHLTSSIPVSVYQFNALEYKAVGGPPGKMWSTCIPENPGQPCYSYTNDASLLIPTTAMTGNYRVTSEHGSSFVGDGGFIAITATQAGTTTVVVTLSSTASVLSGGSGSDIQPAPNGTISLSMKQGDVVELIGAPDDSQDLSGSLVQASGPVQVIAGRDCADQPDPVAACDHLESSVLPAETLGKDYVVTVPTSPNAKVVGHKVRFYGNVDNTVLTYNPAQPPGCPSTLNAGEVAECTGTPGCATGTNITPDAGDGPVSVSCVTSSFEVTGTNAFAVSSFMLGGSAVDPGNEATSEGDPSMSPMVAVEQYRERYIFLAPADYDQSYADVVVPVGGSVTLDNVPVTATTPLNATWSIARLPLSAATGGSHVLTGTQPFGVQVIGYGSYTSYQYPAGLDLKLIAPPPPPAMTAK